MPHGGRSQLGKAEHRGHWQSEPVSVLETELKEQSTCSDHSVASLSEVKDKWQLPTSPSIVCVSMCVLVHEYVATFTCFWRPEVSVSCCSSGAVHLDF